MWDNKNTGAMAEIKTITTKFYPLFTFLQPHPSLDDVLIVRENEYCKSEKVTIFIGVIYAYKGLLLVSFHGRRTRRRDSSRQCLSINLTILGKVPKINHRTFTFHFLFVPPTSVHSANNLRMLAVGRSWSTSVNDQPASQPTNPSPRLRSFR